jgi:hypothetical protein
VTGNAGSGASSSTLYNCIVYFNRGPNYDATSVLTYCCTTPLPPNGVGNISSDPQLANSSHLSAGSPCRGAGSADYASGTDIDGEPWANPPAIGCDDYHAGALTGPLSVGLSASFTNAAAGFAVQLTALIGGRPTANFWDFGDGLSAGNQPYTSHAWTVPGDYVVVFHVYNESQPGGISATGTIHIVTGIHYVAAGSTNGVAPYASWATAAPDIQLAISAANVPGALVLVTNGTYGPIDIPGFLTVRSVNGPQSTIIYGDPHCFRGGCLGSSCAHLAGGASLSGFTLTGGHSFQGAGLYCDSATAVASNCVVSGNVASEDDGGFFGGTDGMGGGAYGGTLNNCTLAYNSALSGGGAYNSTLNNCTLIGNSVASLFNSHASAYGGGAYNSTLNNCTLIGNSAIGYFDQYIVYGGGEGGLDPGNTWHWVTISIPAYGAAAYGGSLNNCIVLNGTYNSSLNSCWTTDPLFVPGDLRLQSNSPCINAGNNAYVSGGTDRDGRPRLVGGRVDIGAYEFQPDVSGLFLGWLQQYGLPTDGSADTADSDGDGMNNWQEWIAGTNPTDAASALQVLTPLFTPPGMVLRWSSDTNHAYSIERTTSSNSPAAFTLIRTNLPGLSPTTTCIDTTAPLQSAAFYRVGTDSTNGSAPLWLQTPLLIPAAIAVTWTSVSNRSYFVQRSTGLSPAAFSVVQTGIPGQPGTTTCFDTNAIGSGPFFYRVGISR